MLENKNIIIKINILVIIFILFTTFNCEYVNANEIKDSKADHLLELYIGGDTEVDKTDVISAIYDLDDDLEKETLLEKLNVFEDEGNKKDKMTILLILAVVITAGIIFTTSGVINDDGSNTILGVFLILIGIIPAVLIIKDII